MDEDFDEHKQDIVKILGNHIYFYTDVTRESSLQAVKAIKQLNIDIRTIQFLTEKDSTYEDIINDNEDSDSKLSAYSPIYFHINSNGGDFFSGMAIADSIKNSKVQVYTIGEGGIASMASIIFLAGHKRFISKHAYILIHELRTFVSGTFSNLIDDYENSKMFMKNIKDFYKENSKINKKFLDSLLKKDIWFDSKTSIKYGFAHKIV